MTQGWKLIRRRRTYFLAAFAFLFLGLLVVGFQSANSKNRAKRSLARSFSDGKITSGLIEIERFGTNTCVAALADLLEIWPSPSVDRYKKIYDKMPAILKSRLSEPIKRLEVLSCSIEVLGRIGPAAVPAVPGLLRIYDSNDSRIANLRRPALRTLGRIGPGASEAIPILLPGLSPGSNQESVAETLIRIDPDANRVEQALRDFGRQPGQGSFVSNIAASCRIVLEPPRPARSGAIPQASKYPSRWSAFLVIGLFRSESGQTVPVIRSYLADESGVLRGLAVTALGLLGPNAADALPDVRQCLTDEWGSVREAATNAVLAIESRLGDLSRGERSIP